MEKVTQIARRFGCAVILGFTTLIGSFPGVLCAQTTGHAATVDSRILDDYAAGQDEFAVIVHLWAPPEATAELSPDSNQGDRVRVEVNRSLGLTVTTRLRSSLGPTDLRRVRPFLLQPGFSAVVSRQGLRRVLGDRAVRLVEVDRSSRVHTLEGLAMIGGDQLQLQGYSGEGTAVAIIDTGIDYFHPALGGSSIPNVKVVRGLDTADDDDDPMDCGAHGTAVASVAAGSSYQWNPQRRFAGGVAPQAKILAYKASPDDDCGMIPQSAVIRAMEDALLHRSGDDYTLAAINLSFGSGAFEGPCDNLSVSYSNAVSAAMQAGVAVVASAGNDGLATAVASPACVGSVISVGSVWDSDSGSVPFSFCLDPECTITCNDSFVPAGTIACYSNAGSTLDVLAPSEYLKAARANGKTIDFGGTSGAAAYVTGSLALLRQIDPAISPAAAGRLLQLTGRSTLDQRSGMVRPTIDLIRMIESASQIHSPEGHSIPIPRSPGMAAVSTIDVADNSPVGSIRVLLHVDHSDPEALLIVIRAPDGTEARLHDHTAGSIVESGSTITNQGVWGLYPDELQPADSLAVFSGISSAGTWSLRVIDESGGGQESSGGTLVGWALAIAPVQPPAHGDLASLTIPVVANGPGALGTDWASDVRIFNHSGSSSATGRLYLLPASSDGDWTYRQTDVVIPRNSVLDLAAVLANRFAAYDIRGSLRLESTQHDLTMTSRTFTADDDRGTYGQFIGVVEPELTLGDGSQPVALLQLTENEDHRTNLGFTEVEGKPVVLRVTGRDGRTGAGVGQPMLIALEPFGNVQKRLGEGRGDNQFVVVETVEGDGRASVYASVVDNRTGDAIFVPPVRPTAPGDVLVVPVVARQEGRSDTQWRTDVRIANFAPVPATLDLTFRPREASGGSPATVQSTVPPGTVFAIDDVVGTLFGLSETVGSLTISQPETAAAIAATSRTYNRAAHGTFGQFVGAVTSGVGPSARLTHLGSSPQMRTNIGLCEVSGGTVQVSATLRDAIGREIGDQLVLTAEPYQLVQVDDVFTAAGAEPTPVATVELHTVLGDGDWVAYASVVDATTGDAIYVPAVHVDD